MSSILNTREDIILERLMSLVDQFDARKENYLISYPYFIECFKNIDEIKVDNLIIGISFVYSWMPTILKKIDNNNFEKVLYILNKVKQNKELFINDYSILKNTFNNSLVGASKILHFINPDGHAIWDSNVYDFLNPGFKPHSYRVENIDSYLEYLSLLSRITRCEKFDQFYNIVQSELNNYVSKFRAIELIMFKNGS